MCCVNMMSIFISSMTTLHCCVYMMSIFKSYMTTLHCSVNKMSIFISSLNREVDVRGRRYCTCIGQNNNVWSQCNILTKSMERQM